MARRKSATTIEPGMAGPKALDMLHLDQVDLMEDDWNVPATDNRGHSAKLTTRVPPVMARAVEQLVQSRVYPFPTSDDFQRFAIRLALHVLNRAAGGHVVTTLTAAEAIVKIVRDYENLQAVQSALEMARQSCEAMMADGDASTLASHLAYIDHTLAKMSATSAWRRKFEADWKHQSQRYRNYLRSVNGVSEEHDGE